DRSVHDRRQLAQTCSAAARPGPSGPAWFAPARSDVGGRRHARQVRRRSDLERPVACARAQGRADDALMGMSVAALRRMWRSILLLSAALVACGCAPARVTGTARITSGPLPAPSGVYVPAQTSAVVRLEGPLDTATSSAGQP